MDKKLLRMMYKPKIVSANQNKKNMQSAMDNWHLGPEKTSVKPTANKEFWSSFADVMDVPEKTARRLFCANCEYFNNTPEMMKAMEEIPLNAFDMDGGGRGYCEKLDFICHNLRVCQAWERKDFELEDMEDD